jgi:hypothetical protein
MTARKDRELKKLNSPQISEPIKKWATELNRTFSKEETQMAKIHMKKCSPSLATKEMQIKTTLRFHLTPVRIAIIKFASECMELENIILSEVSQDQKTKNHMFSLMCRL